MQRYFIKAEQITTYCGSKMIIIDEKDSHHIKNVMRMQIMDKVIATTNNGSSYLCEIIDINDYVTLKVLNEINNNNELKVKITIAQGLMKKGKLEDVIRHLVELGCFAYIPVMMERSVVKIKEENIHYNERIIRIIKEASEQSERQSLMELKKVMTFKELVASLSDYDLVLVASAADKDDINSLNYIKEVKKYQNVLVIIGPEGGISPNELNLLKNNNCKIISLGKRILRCETAPLATMAILAYEVENNEY